VRALVLQYYMLHSSAIGAQRQAAAATMPGPVQALPDLVEPRNEDTGNFRLRC
jgi:hypothetical protein